MASNKSKEAPQENAAPAASPEYAEKPKKLDETRPGGYYIIGNRAVNAHGELIEFVDEHGKPIKNNEEKEG